MLEPLNVVLGCFGRIDDNFVSCSKVENIILVVDNSLYHYSDIMNYLDMYKLFDRHLLDYNAIRHFIFKMRDKFDQVNKRLWDEKQFNLYQKFVIDHKRCGLFIRLDITNQ